MYFIDNYKKEWYVIISRPKWEKKVAKNLSELEIEHLIPIQRQLRQWSDRKKWVDVPIFSTYGFVHCTERERVKVFKADGVCRFLSIAGVISTVSESEILRIRSLLNYDKDVIIEEYCDNIFSYGDEVEIISGSLVGLKGIVSDFNKNGQSKIKIIIESLNCFGCTEISTDRLRLTTAKVIV